MTWRDHAIAIAFLFTLLAPAISVGAALSSRHTQPPEDDLAIFSALRTHAICPDPVYEKSIRIALSIDDPQPIYDIQYHCQDSIDERAILWTPAK